MSTFKPNNVFLRDHTLAERTCQKWFAQYKNGNFDSEDEERPGAPPKFLDEELERRLDEDPTKTQKELAKTLGVTQPAIFHRIQEMGMIRKEWYELLKPSERITGEVYRRKLMHLSRALREKRMQYVNRYDKCEATYVGETGRTVRIRMAEQERSVKREDPQFEEIVSVLLTHFTPKLNIIFERYEFSQLIQEHGEKIEEYVLKLKKQANKCNFGLNIEEHLRDKFIAGVSNQVILKRLLQEPELTFNMAVNIATTIESVDCNVLKMKSYAETKEINKLHSKCKHCGKMNHHSDRCFFRNSFCYSCKQLGHISTVCHSKSKNGYFQPRKRGVSSEASAHGESFSGKNGYISHIVNGIEKPITFVSRTLNDTEKKYSQIEKEGLSIFFTLNRLKQFLYGRKFIINTDHKPLLAIFGDKNNLPALVANRLHRWSLSISNFNFEIKYTKGTEIPLADFLSRFPNPEKGEKEEEMGEILLIENSILDYVLVSYKTQEDPTLRKLYKLVKYDKYDVDSEVDIKPYNRIKNEITIVRNCLFFGNRMIIPDSLREYVLKIIHENHIGVNKMKTLARSSVYWPGMDEQIEKLSKSCSTCMENTSKLPKQEFTEWTPPNKVWKRIHLDYFYFAGKTFLILVDAHSNWIECQIVPNTSAGFCIDFLRECLARYGIPEVAVMDNGPPFRSYEIKTFFERNGIHAMFSPAYHPESNGLAEVSVREIKKAMKKIISEERELPLEFALIKALYAYRLSPLTRTEKSPAGIFLNREIRTKISMLSKKSVRVGRLKNKKQNNSYKINDRVRYRWMERGKPKWMFGIVKKIVGSNSCMIETDGIERKVHTNYMRRSMERKDVSSSEEGISYPRPQTSNPLTPATIVAESTPGPPTESTPSRRYPLRERRPPDRYDSSSRPKDSTEREDRAIVRMAVAASKSTLFTIQRVTGTQVFKMTINRRLRERNPRTLRPLRCLPLTPGHRHVRLQ
ncbi:K02A2.6-like [Cordylochernes scorpioides]|uniref:RNA-directed DNA polymerase n=1 Tax=Cordylochernes scorpioides TaxID=51811 RepID=A0ABY6K3X4_9ARAC|nr:K02A2.6-like [Cordylochernes scorpioides]